MHVRQSTHDSQISAGWKGKAGLPGPWVFLYRYWAWHCKAAQPMPVPAPLQPSITLTMWILPSVGCWGRNTETPPPKPRRRPATNMFVYERVLLVLLLNYSIPSPWHQPTLDIYYHHQKHPTTAPQPPHAHTHVHPRKEIPISPAPESLNSTPMNALIQPSAREPSDVDSILKRPLPPKSTSPSCCCHSWATLFF